MHHFILLVVVILSSMHAFSAHHDNESAQHHAKKNLVSLKSTHSVSETTDKLIAILKAKGMKVFNRIDHAAGAKSVNLTLRPTQLVIFGNPKVGTKLMQCGQTVGIDLPLKVLILEDQEGAVWLTYNQPKRLVKDHQLTACDAVIKKITGALSNFAQAAISQ